MTDSNDTVTRLNRILSSADERGLDETECRALRDAATEIDALRQELWQRRQDLKPVWISTELAEGWTQMKRERDEARREVCQREAAHQHDRRWDAAEIAERRGWQCFKDTDA